MTYQPSIPSQGVAGWNYLQTSYDRQFSAFTQSGDLQGDTEYFLENIGEIQTSEDLLNDRRLLQVAVKAFGLEEEIDYRALLQRALSEGTTAPDALANTMDDQRYVNLSEAFGFGPGQALLTSDRRAMKDIVDSFHTAAFEEAVGEQDPTMRTALFARRSFPELLGDTIDDSSEMSLKDRAVADFMDRINSDDDENTNPSLEEQWKTMLDRDVLTGFFDISLRIPDNVITMSEEERIEEYISRAEITFGSADPAVIFRPDNVDQIMNDYRSVARGVAETDPFLDEDDIDLTTALVPELTAAMFADDIAINNAWTDMLQYSQVRDFLEVTLVVDDIEDMNTSAALDLLKRKSDDIFGTSDPRAFLSPSNIDTAIEVYETEAEAIGMTNGEASRISRIAESILQFAVPDEPVEASEEAAVDAKWLSVMGQRGLPPVFEAAFDLPADFDEKPLSEQVETSKTKAFELFQTNDPEEILHGYNTTTIFDMYRTNAEARGLPESVISFRERIGEREMNQLFPEEEEQDIDSLLEDLFGDDDEQDDTEINTMWYTIMGQEALTDFMQAALGLPEEVGQMDVEMALGVYKRRAESVLGTDNPAEFAHPDRMDDLVNRYLAQSQIRGFSGGSNNPMMALFR